MAFITGSQVYGNPREDSDIDLVVRMDDDVPFDLEILLQHVDENGVIRFGKLNLVIVESDTEYAVWKTSTAALIDTKPNTKEDAVQMFKRICTEAGIKHNNHSNGN